MPSYLLGLECPELRKSLLPARLLGALAQAQRLQALGLCEGAKQARGEERFTQLRALKTQQVRRHTRCSYPNGSDHIRDMRYDAWSVVSNIIAWLR